MNPTVVGFRASIPLDSQRIDVDSRHIWTRFWCASMPSPAPPPAQIACNRYGGASVLLCKRFDTKTDWCYNCNTEKKNR